MKQHAHTLHALSKARGAVQKKILKVAKAGVVRAICQCASNTLKGNIPLSRMHKSRLARHKSLLRKLASKVLSLKKKKKLLLQGGTGLLPLLLGPILSTLAGTLFSR